MGQMDLTTKSTLNGFGLGLSPLLVSVLYYWLMPHGNDIEQPTLGLVLTYQISSFTALVISVRMISRDREITGGTSMFTLVTHFVMVFITLMNV